MVPAPPKYALKFLRWFCREDYLEEIEGNLIELYELEYQDADKKARWWFYKNVLLHFRPAYMRSFDRKHRLIPYAMYKNYFKIAWRNMLKQKLYSSINIGGLAIGLCCFILIFLYVQHELSFDNFYKNSTHIYRVYVKSEGEGFLRSFMDKGGYAYTTVGLAPALSQEFPEVTHATTIRNHSSLLSFEEDHYYEEGLWADEHYFQVFDHELVKGNPQTALKDAKSIVLSETIAARMFGSKEPMGQSVIFRNGDPFMVTGVVRDLPENSSIQYSFITSITSSEQYSSEMKGDRFNNNDYYTFFTLKENSDPTALQNKLPVILEKYAQRGPDYPFKETYMIQPMAELHFENGLNFDIGKKGSVKYVSMFSVIAVLVLLLACINYMNLAIARSIKRAGEVGMRKVIGATRSQLIGQFLGESVLIAFLALILALILVQYLLPVFSHLIDRPLNLNYWENIWLLPGLILLVLLVGLISGSYPAFVVSALRPVQVLKGKLTGKLSGVKLQRVLTVTQYAISTALIISSIIIYQQFQFIQNKELGYDKEHIITINVLDGNVRNNIESLKNKWTNDPSIISVTTTSELPTNVSSGTLVRHPHQTRDEAVQFYRARVDYNYLKVFDLELIAGRTFSPDIQSDLANGRILNETAVKALGWTPEEAIGKQITDWKDRTVIGVVKDFHMHPMQMEIAPMMIQMESNWIAFLALKLRSDQIQETIATLEKDIKAFSPYPFQYQFLDERFDQLYKEDVRRGEIFGFFTILSILIASIGLFGLAAFTATQRTKEIGIRKVLGASAKNIAAMLSRDFIKMVFLGFLLASPIAWYVMKQWLGEFAYRIDIQWWVFLLSGFGAIAIATLTIGSQSFKAALADPVDSLRNE